MLHITRNRATYHYDKDAFQKAQNKLIQRYGKDSLTHILITENGEHTNFHFLLPDKIRSEIGIGLRGAASGDKEIQALVDISADFRTFLFNFFNIFDFLIFHILSLVYSIGFYIPLKNSLLY